MIYRVFDRDWNNSQFAKKIDSFKHIARAVDFNALSCHGEALPNDIDPFFIGIFTDEGKLRHFMFYGVGEKDNTTGQVDITATCLKVIFNTEKIITWDAYEYDNLGELLDFIFFHIDTLDVGFNYDVDYQDIYNTSLSIIDLGIDIFPQKQGIYNIFSVLKKLLYYYNLYIDYTVSLKDKKVNFIINKAVDTKNLILSQYNISDDVKANIGLNMAQVVKSDDTGKVHYFLTRDNRITTNIDDPERLFPAIMKCFIAEVDEDNDVTSVNYYQAKVDAILALAERRYQQNFDISVAKQDRLFAVDFQVNFNVYGSKGFYKSLPIGEIETNHNDIKVLRIGYRPQFLTQVL